MVLNNFYRQEDGYKVKNKKLIKKKKRDFFLFSFFPVHPNLDEVRLGYNLRMALGGLGHVQCIH